MGLISFIMTLNSPPLSEAHGSEWNDDDVWEDDEIWTD